MIQVDSVASGSLVASALVGTSIIPRVNSFHPTFSTLPLLGTPTFQHHEDSQVSLETKYSEASQTYTCWTVD
jgi:hypothetical protein